MPPSLSLILPVAHAETRLENQILGLCDVVPELTSHFELLIVDHSGADEIAELSMDLARRYPQIRAARTPRMAGDAQLLLTGLEASGGDVVLYRPAGSRVEAWEVGRLWPQIATHDVVLGAAGFSPHAAIRALGRIFRQPLREPGLWLMRRAAAYGVAAALVEQVDLITEIEQLGLRHVVVETRTIGGSAPPTRPPAAPKYLRRVAGSPRTQANLLASNDRRFGLTF